MHVCLCAEACLPRIFFRGRCFWRMHVYACSHDMHILYSGCVHTRGTTMLHTIAPHTCARWASFERQTYFSIFNIVFFFFNSSGFVFCWICLSLRFCLFIHFFQCCFFRFCSYTLKFERATTWWISWKRCSLFLPILRKLLSNVRACEVMLVAHSTRQSIYWS